MLFSRKIAWFFFTLLFVTETYGEETLHDSVVSVLSAMDLKNVKKENDRKIDELITRLDEAGKNNYQSAVSKVSANAGNIVHLSDAGGDNRKETSVIGSASENSDDKKKSSEDYGETIDFSGEMDLPELQNKLGKLSNRISLMANKLDMLIKLQKLSYDNRSITNEIEGFQPTAAKTGKINKGDDYFSRFSREKGVKIYPAGFAYNILKAGTGKITADNIFRLTLTETKSGGAKISSVSDVMLRYNSTLPIIIYNAVKYIGFGGQIKVVALARKVYPKGDYPNGVGPDTPLIYMINISTVR